MKEVHQVVRASFPFPAARFPAPARLPVTARFLAAALLIAACLPCTACTDDVEDKPPEKDPLPVVAQVQPGYDLLTVSLRKPGELEFTPAKSVRDIVAGTSIRSERSFVVLNVAGSIQVQMSPMTELLLVGPTQRDGSAVIAMGLQSGEVRIQALSCPTPVVVETPVGTVKGVSAHLTANLAVDEVGAFALNAQALTDGITLETEHGILPIPLMGRAFKNEEDPPKLLPLQPYR